MQTKHILPVRIKKPELLDDDTLKFVQQLQQSLMDPAEPRIVGSCGFFDAAEKKLILAEASLGYFLDVYERALKVPERWAMEGKANINREAVAAVLQGGESEFTQSQYRAADGEAVITFLPKTTDAEPVERFTVAAAYYSGTDLLARSSSSELLRQRLNVERIAWENDHPPGMPYPPLIKTLVEQYIRLKSAARTHYLPNCRNSPPDEFLVDNKPIIQKILLSDQPSLLGAATAPPPSDATAKIGGGDPVVVVISAASLPPLSHQTPYQERLAEYLKQQKANSHNNATYIRHQQNQYTDQQGAVRAAVAAYNSSGIQTKSPDDPKKAALELSSEMKASEQTLSNLVKQVSVDFGGAHIGSQVLADPSYLKPLSEIKPDSPWTAALARQAKNLIQKGKDAPPRSDAAWHEHYTMAVRALNVAAVAGARGAETLAKEAFDLSHLMTEYLRDPRAAAEISVALGPGMKNIMALADVLNGKSFLLKNNLGDSQVIISMFSSLPPGATPSHFGELADTLKQIGYGRPDLLARAAQVTAVSPPPDFAGTASTLDGLRGSAPYLVEQTAKYHPEVLRTLLSDYAKLAKDHASSADFMKPVQATLYNANDAALEIDKTRNLLAKSQKVQAHFTPQAIEALRQELNRLETIAQGTLHFGATKAANEALERLSAAMKASAYDIYEATAGTLTAVQNQVYALSDLPKAFLTGKAQRAILDGITYPPETAARVYNSYLATIRLAQTADNPRALGEAYTNLAISTFLLTDGGVTLGTAALNAAKSSLALQNLGRAAAEQFGNKPWVKGLLEDEAGALRLDPKQPIKTPSGSKTAEMIRHEIQQIYRPNMWTPGVPGNPIDNILEHYADHAKEFPSYDVVDYVNAAHKFGNQPPEGCLFKGRELTGDVLMFDPKTETLLVVDAKGTPRTMLILEKRGYSSSLERWNKMPETPIDRNAALKRIRGT